MTDSSNRIVAIKTHIGGRFPRLEEKISARRRKKFVSREIIRLGYVSKLGNVKSLASDGNRGFPSHLVVVPQVGPNTENWKAGQGNFFFEIYQSAKEFYPETRISVFEVAPGEPSFDWHLRLIRYLVESRATHLIAQVEADPNSSQSTYSWDIFWTVASKHWSGVFLGLATDSYFRWIRASLRALARISDNFVLIDICEPMTGVLVSGRTEVGPVNMPISRQSLDLIDAAFVSKNEVEFDASFIGTLYPYRVELLNRIQESGINLEINPHRVVPAVNYEDSRNEVPSYVDYMLALGRSKVSVNFSKCNAGSGQQLKTRVLEAAAMGSLVLTDDRALTSRFWDPGVEFGFFAGPEDLERVLRYWLSDPVRLERCRKLGQRKARRIAVSGFWQEVNVVLKVRGKRIVD